MHLEGGLQYCSPDESSPLENHTPKCGHLRERKLRIKIALGGIPPMYFTEVPPDFSLNYMLWYREHLLYNFLRYKASLIFAKHERPHTAQHYEIHRVEPPLTWRCGVREFASNSKLSKFHLFCKQSYHITIFPVILISKEPKPSHKTDYKVYKQATKLCGTQISFGEKRVLRKIVKSEQYSQPIILAITAHFTGK